MTRAKARLLRAGLSPETRAAHSEAIALHVLKWETFRHARSVMAYASVGSEVDTAKLLHAILSLGKRLYLPRCGESGRMDAVETADLSSLVPGRLSIPEPGPSVPAADKRQIDLILTPGLLFDQTGARLGQGGGYYDRFLSDYSGKTCGLAFSVQMVRRLIIKAHDVSVHALATEHGILQCGEDK